MIRMGCGDRFEIGDILTMLLSYLPSSGQGTKKDPWGLKSQSSLTIGTIVLLGTLIAKKPRAAAII